MAAINTFCYRAQKCLEETESKDRELKTIKGIVRNNNYNTNIADKVMKRVNIQKAKIEPELSLIHICQLLERTKSLIALRMN